MQLQFLFCNVGVVIPLKKIEACRVKLTMSATIKIMVLFPPFSFFVFSLSIWSKLYIFIHYKMNSFIYRHFYFSYVFVVSWYQKDINFRFLQTYYKDLIILGKFVQWKTTYIPHRKCHTTVKYVSDICKCPKLFPRFKNFNYCFPKVNH